MSLKHYRLQSKQLLKDLKAGNREAAGRVSRHLPRLSGHSTDDVLAAAVSLQEAQHVIAREHGYRQWADLPGVNGGGFEALRHLSDGELESLLRRIKRRDFITVLMQLQEGVEEGAATARHEVCAAFWRLGVGEHARQQVMDEGQLFQALAEDLEKAQRRIVEEAEKLGQLGTIGWPPGVGRRRDTPPPAVPRELQLMAQPLEALSPAQLRQLMHGLASVAEADGMLCEATLADALAGCASEYLARGVRYVVDGTEPDLARDLLETKAQTLLRYQRTRQSMIIEGMAAIASGDNPRVVQHKVSTLYVAEPEDDYRAPEQTVEPILAQLDGRPASELNLHELVELLGDISWIARRACASLPAGQAAVLPLADAVDEEMLALGLRKVAGLEEARKGDPEQYPAAWRAMTRELEQEMDSSLAAARLRYSLVIEGLTALCEGRRGDALDAALDAAAR